jgi:hypothetical protein
VKVLLDEMLPAGVAGLLPEHEVVSVQRAGYKGLKNDELPSLELSRAPSSAFSRADAKPREGVGRSERAAGGGCALQVRNPGGSEQAERVAASRCRPRQPAPFTTTQPVISSIHRIMADR